MGNQLQQQLDEAQQAMEDMGVEKLKIEDELARIK